MSGDGCGSPRVTNLVDEHLSVGRQTHLSKDIPTVCLCGDVALAHHRNIRNVGRQSDPRLISCLTESSPNPSAASNEGTSVCK
jgi:hypothetical protein